VCVRVDEKRSILLHSIFRVDTTINSEKKSHIYGDDVPNLLVGVQVHSDKNNVTSMDILLCTCLKCSSHHIVDFINLISYILAFIYYFYYYKNYYLLRSVYTYSISHSG